MNKNILKHIIRYILIICIIILCCTIFKFSAADGKNSSGTSGRFINFLLDTFSDGKQISENEKIEKIEHLQPFIRKGAHFSIYMILGILTICCAQTFKGSKAYKFDFSTMFCFIYACTDELHQKFIPRKKRRICRCVFRYSCSNSRSINSYGNYIYYMQNKA